MMRHKFIYTYTCRYLQTLLYVHNLQDRSHTAICVQGVTRLLASPFLSTTREEALMCARERCWNGPQEGDIQLACILLWPLPFELNIALHSSKPHYIVVLQIRLCKWSALHDIWVLLLTFRLGMLDMSVIARNKNLWLVICEIDV